MCHQRLPPVRTSVTYSSAETRMIWNILYIWQLGQLLLLYTSTTTVLCTGASRRLDTTQGLAHAWNLNAKHSVDTAPHTPPTLSPTADVDGTLIHSIGKDANKLHKECFSAGFKEVFGLDTHIDIIPHHGGTDPLIAIKVLEHCGVPKAEVGGCKLCGFHRVLHAVVSLLWECSV